MSSIKFSFDCKGCSAIVDVESCVLVAALRNDGRMWPVCSACYRAASTTYVHDLAGAPKSQIVHMDDDSRDILRDIQSKVAAMQTQLELPADPAVSSSGAPPCNPGPTLVLRGGKR